MSVNSHTNTPTGNPTFSRKWHTSPSAFPGNFYILDIPATVSNAEISAINQNIIRDGFDTPPLAWEAIASISSASRNSELNEILARCGIYNAAQQRWDLGPDLEERSLVDGFRRLLEQLFFLSGIESRFVVSRDLGIVPDLDSVNKSSPPLAICRDSCSLADGQPDPPGYRSCLVPVEVRRQKDFVINRALFLQLALYARRCFMMQPERGKVYCFTLTEATLYIARFDRSGYYSSAVFDINKNPRVFIHLVLSLSQPDNLHILDFVFWRQNTRWMRLNNANNANVTIRFQVEGIVYVNNLLCGRGTTCWKVKSQNTSQHFLVKRTWDLKEVDGESEAMLLASAKDLPYVAQVVAYTEDAVLGLFPSFPRVHRVVVVEYYKRSIINFRNKTELLYIIRDAVEGHRNLWNVGICHRDIRPINIRIKPCKNVANTAGTQGILVGLSRAKRVGKLAPTVLRARDAKDTHMYQSVFVLHAAEKDLCIYPDYVDDLESFFYILCHFCSVYRDHSDFYRIFRPWNSTDPHVALHAKLAFLAQKIPENFVAPYFGQIVADMLESMRTRLYHLFMLRSEFNRRHAQHIPQAPISVDEYRVFLAYINCAIAEMNADLTSGCR